MKKTAIGIVAGLLLACVALAQQATKVQGWITDGKCAAKGGDLSNAACAKKCAAAGEKLVLVADKDKKIYTVENQDAVKGHEGHHVVVAGQVKGDTIHVESVDMAQ
ncbi:MAG TPA: hypothetical protein VEH49_03720 [Methylomirabilota bacterium]|nr:hypothetical protein [Methylomirabilota bacterium]